MVPNEFTGDESAAAAGNAATDNFRRASKTGTAQVDQARVDELAGALIKVKRA